jgi:hypothetical protein
MRSSSAPAKDQQSSVLPGAERGSKFQRRHGWTESTEAIACPITRFVSNASAHTLRGKEVPSELLVPGGWHVKEGQDGAARLMELPVPPAAIVAPNDMAAIGAITKVKEARRRRERSSGPRLTAWATPENLKHSFEFLKLRPQESLCKQLDSEGSANSKKKRDNPRTAHFLIQGKQHQIQKVIMNELIHADISALEPLSLEEMCALTGGTGLLT